MTTASDTSTGTASTAGTATIELDVDAMTAAIDAHLVAYGEPDARRRAEMVAAVWSADGELIDPPMDGRGHDGITALGDAVQAHFAGCTFRRTTAVDAHHGVARYGWSMVAPDGTTALTGTDVAEFDGSGRLARIVGFFGDLAPAG